ncbi:aspartate-semialdehyde dehydrogenase [Bavariicoccus seileri]|uniref:aspartate-semialdehyde dehydrogenase n=2 Tax=Bavariicoccus seileri TaxID=549685 RepID=UPI0003B5614E|nr:aspartate-semialdehyde dehydrogenase [Bavariicoccus seileri]
MSKTYNVAVCGATGVVGRKMLQVLEEHDFPINQLTLFASKRSAGKKLDYKGEQLTIQELTEESLKPPIEIALFSAGGDTSKHFAPLAVANGVVVIDNSSAWRMDKEVPLVVPEVNGTVLTSDEKIIANPNCSTIQSVLLLAALQEAFGLKRVVYNTYQAVSGAGQAGLDDLANHTTNKFPYSINDNVLPQIDVFLENGYTKEEEKMINETRKILALPDLRVTATAVRVPVANGHGISINAELEQDFDISNVKEVLANYPGITLVDDPAHDRYPLQTDANDTDDVLVGRIRRDDSVPNGVNLWVVADNIRKGAASNTIQIAEDMVRRELI